MSETPDPKTFFRERFPAQLNRSLAEQEQAAQMAQRALAGMRAVAATIRFDVRGEGGVTVFVNIEGGRSSAGDAPAHPPFLSIAVDRSHYEPLFREAGDNVFGFLGGISGMGAPIKLTRDRVEQIAAVGGTLCFELTGEGGFQLLAKLGDAAPGDSGDRADTTIRVEAQAYRELREGKLEPQQAFLAGKIAVEGDMQRAMQLALAVLSPD
jgi:putative sterol carrier protein